MIDSISYSDDQINDKMWSIEKSLGKNNWSKYCEWLESQWVTPQKQMGVILDEESSLLKDVLQSEQE